MGVTSVSYPNKYRLVEKCLELPSGDVTDCLETSDFNGGIGVSVEGNTKGTAIAFNCKPGTDAISNQEIIRNCMEGKNKEINVIGKSANTCKIVRFNNIAFVEHYVGWYQTYVNNALYTINVEPKPTEDLSADVKDILNTLVVAK